MRCLTRSSRSTGRCRLTWRATWHATRSCWQPSAGTHRWGCGCDGGACTPSGSAHMPALWPMHALWSLYVCSCNLCVCCCCCVCMLLQPVCVLLQVFKTLFEVGAWRAACANASSNVKGLVKTFKVGLFGGTGWGTGTGGLSAARACARVCELCCSSRCVRQRARRCAANMWSRMGGNDSPDRPVGIADGSNLSSLTMLIRCVCDAVDASCCGKLTTH